MRFGQSLKEQRERRSVSLESVSAATKVSLRHLQALENDAYRDLPGGVFNRGIVQSYCRCLGLDEEAWLQQYAAALPAHDPDWTEFAEAVKRGRANQPNVQRRWWGVLVILLALAAISWAAWHFVIRQRVGRPLPDRQIRSALKSEQQPTKIA